MIFKQCNIDRPIPTPTPGFLLTSYFKAAISLFPLSSPRILRDHRQKSSTLCSSLQHFARRLKTVTAPFLVVTLSVFTLKSHSTRSETSSCGHDIVLKQARLRTLARFFVTIYRFTAPVQLILKMPRKQFIAVWTACITDMVRACRRRNWIFVADRRMIRLPRLGRRAVIWSFYPVTCGSGH